MIGYLKGLPLMIAPNRVVLDVQGVGYEVSIPLSTFYTLERQESEIPVGLHISTQVREDAITLFGFSTEREKILFGKLISVSGVGPKLAQAVLSGMAPDELISALRTSDAARLGRIPGVGKKTAARLIVDLKDKLDDLAVPETSATPPLAESESDLVLALLNLGYKRALVERAVAQVSRDAAGRPFAEQLRESLKLLSRV